MAVVLPAPDGPITPTIAPRGNDIEKSRRAVTPENILVTPSRRMASSPAPLRARGPPPGPPRGRAGARPPQLRPGARSPIGPAPSWAHHRGGALRTAGIG